MKTHVIQILAKEVKQESVTYLVCPECFKFSVVVDESTTVSNRTVLICYVPLVVHDKVEKVFWELCELNGTMASDMAKSLYNSFVSFLGLQTLKKRY